MAASGSSASASISTTPRTLHRDVLKWVQSLDLALPVKNARRDFSNGVLVAQIFSRYYETDISMHGFQNGNSLKVKRDNWAQLKRFFRKRDIRPGGKQVTDAEAEDILHARPLAAVDFVHRVYTLLTGKLVKAPRAAATGATISMPAYAQPTAARVVYERSREPAIELQTDIGSKAAVMEEALEVHKESLRQQRREDPDRFVPTAVRAEKAARALAAQSRPHAVQEEGDVRAVSVRQVRVQPVPADGGEGGVARLRAEREIRADALRGHSQTSSAADSAMMAGGSLLEASMGYGSAGVGAVAVSSGGTSVPGAGTGAVGPASADPTGSEALAIMDAAIRGALAGTDVERRLPPGRAAPFSLVDILTTDTSFSDELAAAAVAAVGDQSAALAVACLSSPRGFLHALSLFQPLISGVVEATDTFMAVAQAFEDLGRSMSEADASLAFELMQDLAMPAIIPLIKHRPAKRLQLLRILYSFTGGVVRHRRAVISSLHELLDDLHSFLSCLSLLIYIEHQLEPVLQLYLYYARVGIAVTDPHLRASSVSTLAVIANEFPAAVAPFLPRLRTLVADPWWELRAQLAVLASAYLAGQAGITPSRRAAPTHPDSEEPLTPAEQLDDWLSAVLGGTATPAEPVPRDGLALAEDAALSVLDAIMQPGVGRGHSLRVAVAYSSKALSAQPGMAPRFLECLLSLDNGVVVRLLDVDPHGRHDELAVTGHNGGRYLQPPITDEWPVPLIARTVVQRLAPEQPGALPPQAVVTIMALLRPTAVDAESTAAAGDGKEQDEKEDGDAGERLRIPDGLEADLFQPLRAHMAAALCSAATCRYALEALSFVALYGHEGIAALTDATVVDAVAQTVMDEPSADRDECVNAIAKLFKVLSRKGLQDGVREALRGIAERCGGRVPEHSALAGVAASVGL